MHISVPFPSSANPTEAAQKLTRLVKPSLSDIIMFGNELSPEGLRFTTWVPGWEHPLQKSCVRAITPEKPTTAPHTTLMEGQLGQVSRAFKGGGTGPEASTLLLRLLSSHFDHVDNGTGYTKAAYFWRV